jgi:hypothetical protein
MGGTQVKVQPALVAPALQFHHAVALPDRVALDQWQSTGLGKQLGQHHRFVIYAAIKGTYDFAEQRVADIGPR